MPRRVIDLSQPLSRETQVHPFFGTPRIMRDLIHVDYAEDQPSFNAEVIITSNHAATHVDAFGHYDRTPGAEAIAEMPLDTFCGPAVCIDVREYGGKGHLVTAAEAQEALGKAGLELADGDILLFCTDHYNQTAGTPAFLDGFSGVAPASSAEPISSSTVAGWETTSDRVNARKPLVGASEARKSRRVPRSNAAS